MIRAACIAVLLLSSAAHAQQTLSDCTDEKKIPEAVKTDKWKRYEWGQACLDRLYPQRKAHREIETMLRQSR